MTAEEIFNEVLKSPELVKIFNIPKEEIENLDYKNFSEYKVIEIIKAIIRGDENKSDKNAIFKVIQNQIMQL